MGGGVGCLKRGAWTVCRFKEGALQERGSGVFEGEIDTLMYTIHFVLPILFVLTLAFDRTVQYENVALLVVAIVILIVLSIALSTLKKVLVFQKTYFKVKALKMFKISSDCNIKIY